MFGLYLEDFNCQKGQARRFVPFFVYLLQAPVYFPLEPTAHLNGARRAAQCVIGGPGVPSDHSPVTTKKVVTRCSGS